MLLQELSRTSIHVTVWHLWPHYRVLPPRPWPPPSLSQGSGSRADLGLETGQEAVNPVKVAWVRIRPTFQTDFSDFIGWAIPLAGSIYLIRRDAITSQIPEGQNIDHHPIPEAYNGVEIQVMAFKAPPFQCRWMIDLFYFGFCIISGFWEL